MCRALLLAAMRVGVAACCGFTVHEMNSHRALAAASTPRNAAFMDIVRANRGALYAGSPFPDYLYACGPNHDNGEFTHWAPFQGIASLYIRETYGRGPLPMNASGHVVVSFLAGVVSHYLADISWHGLAETPGGYGLIESIGALDFNHTGSLESDAHTQADTGGEFAAVYVSNAPYDDPTTWVIPLDDLLGIYALANRTDVTAGAIEECAAIFFAGAEAVRALAALAEPLEIASSPTLGESFIDMPVGGIDDMSVLLTRMWGRFATWLERGPPVPVPGHEYSAARRGVRAGVRVRQALYRVLAPVLLQHGLVSTGRNVNGYLTLDRAASPHAVAAALLEELREPSHIPVLQEGAHHSWTTPRVGDAPLSVALLPLLGLNSSCTATDVIRRLELLARPRTSVTAARSTALPPPAVPVAAAASTVALEYAAAALAVGDFSARGARGDLVLTAYGRSALGVYIDDALGLPQGVANESGVLPQAGGFYVRASSPPATNVRARAPFPQVEPLDVGSSATGSSVYSRLGSSACAVDVNGDGVDDLVLGAPLAGWAWSRDPWDEAPLFLYQGRVEVFLGVRGQGLPLGPAAAPSIVIHAITNLSFIGATLSCDADLNGDGLLDVVIGSPFWQGLGSGARGTGAQQQGRVDVFFSSAATFAGASPATPLRVPITAADVTIVGSDQFEWAGHALAALTDASDARVAPLDLLRVTLGALAPRAVGEEADLLHATPPVCAALAHAVLAIPASDAAASALLLVGSPGYRRDDGDGAGWAAVGRLSAYLMPPPVPRAAVAALSACLGGSPPAPLFTITADRALTKGPKISTKLGAAVAVGHPLGAASPAFIALAVPDVDLCNSSALLPGGHSLFNTSAGVVSITPLSPALRGDVSWSALTTAPAYNNRAVLASALPDARFGWRLSFDDVLPKGSGGAADDLLVGAPQYTPFFLGDAPDEAADSGREAGALFIFKGGAIGFPRGSSCAAESLATWWAVGAVQYGRLGSASPPAVRVDWDNDGVAELVVGAPRAALAITPQDGGVRDSAPPEYGGAVLVFDLTVAPSR